MPGIGLCFFFVGTGLRAQNFYYLATRPETHPAVQAHPGFGRRSCMACRGRFCALFLLTREAALDRWVRASAPGRGGGPRGTVTLLVRPAFALLGCCLRAKREVVAGRLYRTSTRTVS